MKYLLDTNICIYLINHKPITVKERFEACRAGDIALSTITLYELLYGAYKSAKPEQNREAVRMFAAPMEILPFGIDAADRCGAIRAALEQKGKTIGAMDMQIAAIALASNLTLVSNNLREFERIELLKLENWVA